MKAIELYSTSYAIVATIFLAIIILLFDNEPTSFPLSDDANSIDCGAIEAVATSSETSRLNFSVKIDKFVEYPQNVALSMLKVKTYVGNAESTFTRDQFWDVAGNGSFASFVVLHQLSGNVAVDLMCEKRVITRYQAVIDSVPVYPVGWSKSQVDGDLLTSMTDFCFHRNKIVFFSAPAAKMGPLRVYHNLDLPIVVQRMSAEMYQQDYLLPWAERTTIIVSAIPREPWRQLTEVLLPVWGAIFHDPNPEKWSVAFTKKQWWLEKNVQYIIPHISDLSGGMCFHDGRFATSYGAISIEEKNYEIESSEAMGAYLRHITSYTPDVVAEFKKLFTNHEMQRGRITISRTFMDYIDFIKSVAPGSDVVVMPDTDDIAYIADVVSSSQLLIADDISTIVYAMFLSPGATLLEVQKQPMKCTRFGEKFSNFAGANYISYGDADSCECTNIECYMISGQCDIDREILADRVITALQ